MLRVVPLASVLLLLVFSPLLGAGSKVQSSDDCLACRRACMQEYRDCVEQGLVGCEEVQAACIESCPCP